MVPVRVIVLGGGVRLGRRKLLRRLILVLLMGKIPARQFIFFFVLGIINADGFLEAFLGFRVLATRSPYLQRPPSKDLAASRSAA